MTTSPGPRSQAAGGLDTDRQTGNGDEARRVVVDTYELLEPPRVD